MPSSDNKIGKASLKDAVLADAAVASKGAEGVWVEISPTPKPLDLKLKATAGQLP